MQSRLDTIQEKLERSCQKVGIKREGIQLIAVTKKVTIDLIQEAVSLGLNQFGESRVQESLSKFESLQSQFPEMKWHMIGHLQSNKIGSALRIFELIQTIDSISILEKIDRQAKKMGKVQDCLVELKVSEENAKTGVLPQDLELLLERGKALENIRLKGILCMAPYFEDPERARPYFSRAREFWQKGEKIWNVRVNEKPILSMGMSHDFEVAVEEGSTMIRIGSALFGERL